MDLCSPVDAVLDTEYTFCFNSLSLESIQCVGESYGALAHINMQGGTP